MAERHQKVVENRKKEKNSAENRKREVCWKPENDIFESRKTLKYLRKTETSQSTSPRIATTVFVGVSRGCAGQFGPHYIRTVPAEFYHGLDLVKWDGGTTDCFGLECAETASGPCRQSSTPSHTLVTEATENEARCFGRGRCTITAWAIPCETNVKPMPHPYYTHRIPTP